MKAAEQYFPVVMFIVLYKVVLTFESVDEILKCDHANESHWAVLSCCNVYCAVQGGSNFSFEPVDEILKCEHSNESYWAVLSCGTIHDAVRGGSNVGICGWDPKRCLFLTLSKWFFYFITLKRKGDQIDPTKVIEIPTNPCRTACNLWSLV